MIPCKVPLVPDGVVGADVLERLVWATLWAKLWELEGCVRREGASDDTAKTQNVINELNVFILVA